MDKKTKVILSIIGIGAIAVPVALLLFVTSRSSQVPEVPIEKRQINARNVEQTTQKTLPDENPTPTPTPTPAGATGSALPTAPSEESPFPVED